MMLRVAVILPSLSLSVQRLRIVARSVVRKKMMAIVSRSSQSIFRITFCRMLVAMIPRKERVRSENAVIDRGDFFM